MPQSNACAFSTVNKFTKPISISKQTSQFSICQGGCLNFNFYSFVFCIFPPILQMNGLQIVVSVSMKAPKRPHPQRRPSPWLILDADPKVSSFSQMTSGR